MATIRLQLKEAKLTTIITSKHPVMEYRFYYENNGFIHSIFLRYRTLRIFYNHLNRLQYPCLPFPPKFGMKTRNFLANRHLQLRVFFESFSNVPLSEDVFQLFCQLFEYKPLPTQTSPKEHGSTVMKLKTRKINRSRKIRRKKSIRRIKSWRKRKAIDFNQRILHDDEDAWDEEETYFLYGKVLLHYYRSDFTC